MKRIFRLLIVSMISFMALASFASPSLAAGAGTGSSSADSATTGWFPHSYIARVGVSAANVRSCASTRCRIVTKVYRGTRVRVYYRLGGWSYIGGGHWIASYLLTR